MKNVYKFHDGLFYPPELEYESIPASAINVSVEEFHKAMSRPAGWTFSVNSDGLVTLIEPPPPTKEQLIIAAETQRTDLRQRANDEISWRQDAYDADIATDEETAALSEWKKYRVLLMRVDTAKPVWPTPPGEPAS
ncbi:tail fiber assembly protein [Citrobacter sp. Cb025]|uniref:tail fiber assembly protein n=1 Tax=Citrobacter TaxID=544 RepID=UPI0019082E0A|nr:MULTISPECIES: tail fiber assembly protein [Citrobacter]EKW6310397.1 tail fiber assembly protein [Escherichia coli]MBJ9046034.1 tail fiber assembly protein [Citrobacter braakii]MDM3419071.1 tail fiber assembly protein [Citrobacter sp. Cb025]HBC6265919.1 tail fiber assembly protein [Citrobacter braakii]HBC8732126.1 tail fiber assembly protein [Citrobacter braakii]